MIKHTISTISFLLILFLNVSAQTYDLRFIVVGSNETNYDVQVQIRSSSTFKIAASNITFDYNTAAISNPSLLSAQNYSGINGNSVYGDMSVTQPDAGIASINIIYTYSTDAHAADVPTTWTDVAIIRFNVVNAGNTPNLVFRTSGLSQTTIYKIEGSTITLLSPGDLYANNEPLPVELASFSAAANDDVVVLSWITKTEKNNYGFSVERRVKNEEWVNIGFVNGYGNSNSPKNYSFRDKTSNGTFSYRLKQIDTDGSYQYSDPITVEVKAKPMKYDLANYPNPFNPETKIQFELPQASRVNLTVYNIIGEKVVTLADENMEAGVYQRTFSSNSYYGQLSSGIYFYKLTTDNGINITKKMVLAK